jgi:hypothetical protein
MPRTVSGCERTYGAPVSIIFKSGYGTNTKLSPATLPPAAATARLASKSCETGMLGWWRWLNTLIEPIKLGALLTSSASGFAVRCRSNPTLVTVLTSISLSRTISLSAGALVVWRWSSRAANSVTLALPRPFASATLVRPVEAAVTTRSETANGSNEICGVRNAASAAAGADATSVGSDKATKARDWGPRI